MLSGLVGLKPEVLLHGGKTNSTAFSVGGFNSVHQSIFHQLVSLFFKQNIICLGLNNRTLCK